MLRVAVWTLGTAALWPHVAAMQVSGSKIGEAGTVADAVDEAVGAEA